IPQANDVADADGGKLSAVGPEYGVEHDALMADRFTKSDSRFSIPDARGAISAGRDEPCAVAAEGNEFDGAGVIHGRRDRLCREGIPDAGAAVGAGSGDATSVLAEGGVIDPTAVRDYPIWWMVNHAFVNAHSVAAPEMEMQVAEGGERRIV